MGPLLGRSGAHAEAKHCTLPFPLPQPSAVSLNLLPPIAVSIAVAVRSTRRCRLDLTLAASNGVTTEIN
jgi:hypothetical protein